MSRHIYPRMVFAALAASIVGLIVGGATANATIVGGGGSTSRDCFTVFDADVNSPVNKPKNIVCNDGDPCDFDGVANGVCNFKVAVCANSTYNAGICDYVGVRLITVEHSADNGDLKFDPEFQALQTRIDSDLTPYPNNTTDSCTMAPTNFFVPIKGPFKNDKCKKNKKQVKLITESTPAAGMGSIIVDKDKIDLICNPPVAGDPPVVTCDPGVLFTSTYDRVQRQIFDQHCAVSGCHDSNGFNNAGDLLLEGSAFPGNLINRTPTNANAQGLGWKRITQIDMNTGDSEASFIVHKLRGDFPGPGFGDRMPKDHPKLDSSLIDVITLWIQAGAPDSGWVPGTD